jgi:hypothetical protein
MRRRARGAPQRGAARPPAAAAARAHRRAHPDPAPAPPTPKVTYCLLQLACGAILEAYAGGSRQTHYLLIASAAAGLAAVGWPHLLRLSRHGRGRVESRCARRAQTPACDAGVRAQTPRQLPALKLEAARPRGVPRLIVSPAPRPSCTPRPQRHYPLLLCPVPHLSDRVGLPHERRGRQLRGQRRPGAPSWGDSSAWARRPPSRRPQLSQDAPQRRHRRCRRRLTPTPRAAPGRPPPLSCRRCGSPSTSRPATAPSRGSRRRRGTCASPWTWRSQRVGLGAGRGRAG